VGNNPVNAIDPTGLAGETVAAGSLPGAEGAMGRLTGQNGVCSTESWKAAPTASSEPEEETAKDAEAGGDDGKASDQQNTAPPQGQSRTYTSEMAACDQQLAQIFGGSGARASGNSFEPVGMPGRSGEYRGDYVGPHGELIKGHLQNMMHLYGSADGRIVTSAYVPAGFSTHYPNPRATDELKGGSVVFFYPKLGSFSNVSIVASHIATPGVRREGDRFRIGKIGGPGGDSSLVNHNAPYIHAHFTMLQGRVTATRSLESMQHIPFPIVFCK